MKAALLLLVFAGVIMVLVNELIALRGSPPRVVYKYLPRDLDTYLREEPRASLTFKNMFEEDDVPVWR